jgi:long-subunit fatty acid transport protein
MTTASALAGGFLTNTNQSVLFDKNPARDAAIGLDGVYSNPAGVVFMPEGFHIGFNWQYVHQTRTITTTNPDFALGKKNNGNTVKEFEGVADAPIVPSLQFAYNKGNWSFQANLSIEGGGGMLEFADGLGSFESQVGALARQLEQLGGLGYDMDSYMRGSEYFYGVQLGTAYKITKDLSVYGGLRLLYGSATYKAKLNNLMAKTDMGYVDFNDYLSQTSATVANGLEQVDAGLQQVNAGIAQYQAAGMPVPAELLAQQQQLLIQQGKLEYARGSLAQLQKYADGVNLLCNQEGWGIAPIIGVDYRYKNFNFAAKYEFKTQMRMKNESTLNEASEIPSINKYRDGEKVNEDTPALLAIGAQWKPIDCVSLNVGWHHYFDKAANWYNNTQELLDHDTNEFLAGVEWDINDKFNVSCGGQLTRYGLTDAYMSDIQFNVNSYSVGLGFSYKANDLLTLSAAYFLTDYENYKRNNYPREGVSDVFTRTNRVLAVGCQLDF